MANCDSVAATPGDHADRQPFADTDIHYYEYLINSVSEAIISLDQNLTIKSLNKAAEKLYGWTAEEAVGRNAVELVQAEFPADSYEELYARFMKQGRLEFEMVHTARDGRTITVLSDTALLRDGHGDITGCVAVIRDITDRKVIESRSERQARELEQAKGLLEEDLNAINRLHSISTRYVQKQELPSLMDEIIDAAMESTHADMCSIQAIDMQTSKLRVVASRGLPEGFAEKLDAIHKGHGIREKIHTLDKRFIIDGTTGAPSEMGEHGHETMHDAGISSIHCTPLMNRTGRKLGALAIYFRTPHQTEDRDSRFIDLLARLTADIMERTNAEELIQHGKKSTEILYEVVEKLLEGDHVQEIIQEICTKVMHFLGCDMFTNYLTTRDDPEVLRLYTWGGLSGKHPQEIGTIMRNRFICGRAVESGTRIVAENLQRSGDKKTAHLRSMGIHAYACHPLTVKDEVLGTLSFGSRKKDSFDESELALMRAVCGHVAVALNRLRIENDLKELAEELREKNKLVTDFFTNISHEFKTPLSIILVDLQLMEYRLKGVGGEAQEKLEKMIAVMRQNALRLLRLIGNLLDVTKIDAGFMKARLVNTDFVALISGLVESVRDYAENAGIKIAFESGVDAKTMPLDTEKMERVMLNLLSNAIKHTPEGGHICVAVRSGGNDVTVSVRDDGEGIPEDKKEYIFDRFRQVNTSLTRSSEGCGIGLSLTKALVELLRGKIWFESRLGSGSEFFVKLPVLAENENSHTPEVEGMPRNRKVEMEFSDIHKAGRQA